MFIILSIIFITFCYLWIKKRYKYFEELGVPFEEPIFPYGNLKGIITKFHPIFKSVRLYEKFKGKSPVCGSFKFIFTSFVAIDLDFIKNVLIKDFDAFHNRGLYYNEVDDPLSAMLFNIEGKPWRDLRVKLTPTFTSGKMKMMFSTVLDVSNHMIENLKKSPEIVEIKEVLACFTTDVIGNVAFGLEMNAIEDENSEFRQMGRKAFKPTIGLILKFIFFGSFPKLGRKLGATVFDKKLNEFFLKTVKEIIQYRRVNKIERKDFMDLMIKMENLTIQEITAQCFLFFFAGFETSSSTSTFVLYNLAVHQNIQERLRSEINEIIAKFDGKLTYEGMMEMKYLQMVIDETLRQYAPLPTLNRQASRDYLIENTKILISKGSTLTIPIYAIHNDPEIYPEPEKFDPERFSNDNKAKRHPLAFLPFGEGARNCIGLRFGLMQTKIAIISLLLNFKFYPTNKTPIPMEFDKVNATITPAGGCMWLKIERL